MHYVIWNQNYQWETEIIKEIKTIEMLLLVLYYDHI